MSLCALCGLPLNEGGLCPHHTMVYGSDWCEANRIMCDFFHRKKLLTLPRTEADRRNDYWFLTA